MAKIPELLAPAGSIEAFLAAFKAGADAFYLGFGELNARKRAKNFTADEFSLAANLAHRNGKKIYVAMNTLAFNSDIPAVIDYLEIARENSADAVIVQDWGVLSILREYFPEIPVHASTQMFCHNSLHAEFLKENGVSRIILPREMSLEEIEKISKKTGVEIEIFVHGAMCFSFSGCCLFSSFLTGDSGNLGRCRQPCRYEYEYGVKKEYPFSMKDLSLYDIVPALSRMNIAALKIEGRLKNSEYVYETVSAYRKILDSVKAGKPFTPSAPFNKQRNLSQGYILEGDYASCVEPEQKGTTGEIFGTVIDMEEKDITVECRINPVKGMRLRIQDVAGRNVFEGTLLDFHRKETERTGLRVISWHTGKSIRHDAQAPLTVYQTGVSRAVNAVSDIEKMLPKKISESLFINVNLYDGMIKINLETKNCRTKFNKAYPIKTEIPKTSPMAVSQIEKIFSETDMYPFSVEKIAASNDNAYFVPVGELKRVRRMFYEELDAFYKGIVSERKDSRRKAILDKLAEINAKNISNTRIDFNSENEKSAFMKLDVDIFMIPEKNERTAGAALSLPLFVSEINVEKLDGWIDKLISAGFEKFIIQSYGWIKLFENKKDTELIAGPLLYIVNSFAADYFEKKGIGHFIVSADMIKDKIGDLALFDKRLNLQQPRVVLSTRLKIPNGIYRYKGNKFHPVHFREYSSLIMEESE